MPPTKSGQELRRGVRDADAAGAAAYVSIRQHTSAYVSTGVRDADAAVAAGSRLAGVSDRRAARRLQPRHSRRAPLPRTLVA